MRYTNLDGTTPDKSADAVLRWLLESVCNRERARRDPFTPPRVEPDLAAIHSQSASLTWIGHATFVQRLGGFVTLVDPVWSPRLGWSKRVSRPGLALQSLPQVDFVVITHSHQDHLDMPTLRQLGSDACYIVPSGLGKTLRRAGLSQIVELGWWDSVEATSIRKTPAGRPLRITLVPAHHWSMRTPWDRNRAWWGGYVFESAEAVTYHAGDSAFRLEVFAQIRSRLPRIDVAMLPIGAYEPSWFMSPQHMCPEEAGVAWEMLRARVMVPMHWGTYRLSSEACGEPPERLRAWWAERGHREERLWMPSLGATRLLSKVQGIGAGLGEAHG